MSTQTDSAVRYDKDADGIVTLTMDDPSSSANTMNEAYTRAMTAVVDRLAEEVAAEGSDVKGVVIASAKKTFFAGGDLKGMMQVTKADAERMFEEVEGIKATLRKLETLPVPVVAAINGAALGGGLEIALAANHRIAVDASNVQIGLPEASLGLLPGGGGVTRTVRMFGLQTALMDILLQGPRFKASVAKAKGLVDELVATQDELIPAAKAWILANADNEDAAKQPWDRPGYKMPGGKPSSPALAAFLPAFPALLRKQLKGADYPAQKAILKAAVEGASTDFDTASRVESRYFVSLVTGQNAKNMIQAFFLDLSAINSGSLRPQGVEKYVAKKVVVLGAGMMGAGIAYVCARAGMEVVLKDVSIENAEKGKAYSAKINEKAVSRGKLTSEKSDELLGRITPTADPADAAGADLVIEAVFEDPALKAKVFAEVMPHLSPDALLCSNTSTLPISGLAEGLEDAASRDRFIGLHFFSPVDKMPLVEIIRGKETSDEALAKAYDVVLAIKKTPIVVNDSRGFYTSRVIGVQINEGLAMLGEGVHPVSLERAATQAGFPVGPLQISDELNLELMVKIRKQTLAAYEAAGVEAPKDGAYPVVDKMIELGRSSRLVGKGFYDYDESGKRAGLWPGLGEVFPPAEEQIPFVDIQERMLFIEALETAKCFEEGVLTSAAAANIGSIFGIGFPARLGGAAQFITGYEAADGSIGIDAFIKRAKELAAAYGDRFTPSAYLEEMAAKGEGFPA
ncbi:3-hydroxyacyl-CoA dehydrogenase NAD-binding domain-containing protein [Nocardioides daphniae]|uniref:3-hydroxyacyl-CoA dehydrogenase n=1 Tax=Nocardioides daphniae TaxID=402297 RepID=A0ABQ1Q225_9ACTN|nr:3-hydroxyacyl-CoA dehydrogenase NAD-binding domain-containing protein [Nocardioides daphniae]GGD09322.1 3-hydroxyacyl-CoA dehydrogenase [Nocardioides daphniae]